MPPKKSSAANKKPEREGRRLRLLDHLSEGAFSNESLQDTSAKIARLTRNRDQAEERNAPSSLGEFTYSDTDSITDSTDQSPIQSPIEDSVISPNQSPNENPKSSPNADIEQPMS